MARKSRKNLDNAALTQIGAPIVYNAAAYTRLSSDDTKKRGDSLETQRNIIENYVATTPGIRIVEVYSDNNRTGTNFERPGFQRMMADIESGVINCIIVKDLTRFGRNAIDSGYYLEKYLPTRGVRFIAVTDSYDSNEPEHGLLLPIKNIISESYALDIGRKVKAVHQQNIADGRYVGRLAPYGYLKSPDNCHKLVVDEETAPIVRQIFSLALEGYSVHEITHWLIDAGAVTPHRRNFARGYVKDETISGISYWRSSSVRTILSDRVYLGYMVQGKSRTFNGRQVLVDPSEWICIPNTHEAIISNDDFIEVQALRQVVYDQAKEINKTPYSENLLKGKVYCEVCGRLLHRKRQNKDGTYWLRCTSQLNYGDDACCIVSVKEAEVFSSIMETLRKESPEVIDRFSDMKAKVAVISGVDGTAEAELRKIESELRTTEQFKKSLYENLVKGNLTQDEYATLKGAYEAKIEELNERAAQVRSQRSMKAHETSEYGEYASAVTAAITGGALTRELADALIEKVVVRKDKSFEVSYRFDGELKEVC